MEANCWRERDETRQEHQPVVDSGWRPSVAQVVDAFAKERSVTAGAGKGFGSGALKVNGRIFAIMASTGEFVVKLSKARVDALVDAGDGERFDPGRGRQM